MEETLLRTDHLTGGRQAVSPVSDKCMYLSDPPSLMSFHSQIACLVPGIELILSTGPVLVSKALRELPKAWAINLPIAGSRP